ncbi:MAG: DNA helicase RecQ [Gammaproteobacteria bacterium]|nr:DNA helicase RecQ [Gammaproteobacteria bacterium]
MEQALEILRNTFGYRDFRGDQQDIINHVLAGNDALVLMPTGGGKSLCYQVPAMIRPGTGIIISPLIALMQDQVSALLQLGIRAAFLNSTLPAQTVRETEQGLLNNDMDLLYIAPERLLQERTLALLERTQLALFAIDEAHCVSQWGHDFRKDYLALDQLHQRFPSVPRIALTATADERTRYEIRERLGLEQAKVYISGFNRPNIRYRITTRLEERKQLLHFLETEHQGDAGIVYCLSRKKTEAVADWLNAQGRTALPYHAGLESRVRYRHQQRFLQEEGIIIVATIAFGMGIDKPDVRFVAHLDLPKSIEAYYQETGRAGRDGAAANAWMVYGLEDVVKLRQMLEQSDADETHKRVERYKLDSMLGLCEITSCRRHALLQYFGEESPVRCGNCDTCLHPVETWDGTTAARKALSCVYRTGQLFGARHLIDVLLGKENDKVRKFGHQRLSTFGIGEELGMEQWRSVFRQLIARGFLSVDLKGFGSLLLTDQSRPLLQGEAQVFLRKDDRIKKPTRKQRKTPLQVSDPELFEKLKDCRKQLAVKQGLPPYVIFHDSTLVEMTQRLPSSPDELLQVGGVGAHKLEQYGEDFLAVIRGHRDEPSIG